MSNPFWLVNRFTRPLINRATRGQRENAPGGESDSTRRLSSGAPLIFETLEPRLLLAADPLGLVAAYSFDEGTGTIANDSSGQFNTATLNNGVAWVVGQHGSAVSFDGVNDYISIPNSASTNISGNAVTLSMWINPLPSGDSVVIGKFWNTTMSSPYYQFGLELDGGNRTDFYVGTTSGLRSAIGGAILPFNQWSYLAITFDGAQVKTYVNGELANTQALSATITARGNPINVGADATPGQFNKGMLDDLRIYNSVLTQAQIQTDMAAPVGETTPLPPDTTLPTVSLTPPASILAGTVNLAATASDNVGVVGVKFLLDSNVTIGSEDTTSPYGVSWNTTTVSNGPHTLTAQARDAANNVATSTAVTVTVDNQPPTGSVVINAGAAATNSTAVTLTLTATDAVTSVTQMRFSNNGTSFSTAETFAPTKAWTLSTGAGTKTVYVQFRDAAGNWSTTVTDTIVLDTTAPTISGRTATNITGISAQITWTTNEPATSRVEYGLTTSYGSLTPLDATPVTAHNVALIGLVTNTTYNYRVISIDAAGNQAVSANSTFKTAAAADTIPPSIPTGLTATAVSTTQINLSWNASTDNVQVTGYQVFRNGNLVGTSTTTTYSDTGLSPNTLYSYTVQAVDAAANPSGQSAPASATTLTPDTILPTVTITAPIGMTPLSGTATIAATASDNVGVVGVKFLLDSNVTIGSEDTISPYGVSWNTTTVSNGPHTLTAQARDAANNVATSTAVTVTVDNQPPTGSVVINAGAAATNSTAVTLTLTATDAVTSVTQMRFSNDGTSFSTAETFAPTKAWTLSTGAGTKTVYVQFRDAAGNWSTTVTDTIVLDTTAPTISGRTATNITGISAQITWTTNEPATSRVEYGLTTSYGSSTPLDATLVTAHNVALIGLVTNTTYNYRVISIDAAGNQAVSANTTFKTAAAADTIPPSIPTGLTATAVSTTQINLSWNASTDNVQVTGYQVFRNGNLVGTSTTTTYSDTGLSPNTLYSYTVQAVDAAANPSGQSAPASATTLTPVVDAPQVLIDFPASGAQVGGIVNVTADATDDTGVAGVQFFVDGVATGSQDATDPYALAWDTRTVSNGAHTLTALATDVDGHTTLSAPVTVNVANGSNFQNEILATGFNLPTAIKFLPDGRMLVVELAGTVKILPPPYTTPNPTPFLQLTNIGTRGVQQGIYDIALDPNFNTNHYYYIFYTLGTPNFDRLSRFTADATLTGTVPGSEFVIYQDTEVADIEHHGGAINFSNDEKILLTTGEHFIAGLAQDLTTPRGKVLRFNMDGTIPTDNPFYDGAGPNHDAIWALGLRNPFRAFYDAPTGRLIIGDVGGNVASTAIEEINIGARGANYGWPNVETPNGNPAYTAPAYYYPHNGRDAAVVAGFVYHGTQFPSSYQGSFFFADYTQNWIKRLTFDANGNVNGVFNFEPLDGSVDGPYGDIVYMTEGPDGALYYVDLGYSDISGTFGVSKIRRISFVNSDLPPVVSASASPTEGPTPLTVNFSSAGSSDPEGQPLTYLWNLGDGTTSTAANPSHTYAVAGPYQARLTVSDGVNSTLSTPLSISAGSRPVATILTPTDGRTFRAGDIITFSGSATDADDGTLPASAYTWNIDFLHEGHVHPGVPITGVTSGTLTIPTSGHDFSGFTRYRVTLTVTDSSGLKSSSSVIVFPEKVNLTFDAAPAGLTLYLDGIAHTAPFVYDTLIGFNHTIEARSQTIGPNTYNFVSWSDGGTQQHTIVAPDVAPQPYTATYNVVFTPAPIAFVQVNAATPQTNQSAVTVAYTSAQVAGDTNILAIGWNNTTSTITSVIDSAGNTYQLAVPTASGSGISQAIYYAKNIKAAAAGTNTVTVTFSASTPFVDIRALEYSGLDPVNPFDVGTSASGNGTSANSGTVTTTAAGELIFGAGMTGGVFSAAGTNFTNRIITAQDGDIAEDRFVTTAGSYSATASLSGSHSWLMQVATFKAAGAGGGDTIAPTVTINQAAGQADPTNTSPINFTVTFSETVTDFTAGDISFAGSTVGGTLTAAVTGSGTTYNVAVSGMTGTGTVVVSVPAGVATDAAGNTNLASTSTDNSVAFSTVDTTAATVQSINRAGTTPTNAVSVSWTVVFSESVTGVDASDFALVTTGAVTGATITTVSGSGSQYTVTANTGTGTGTLGLNLVDNDTILDTSTNRLGGTGSGNGNFTGQSYTIDKTQPSVTINQAAGQADPTSASPINFTVTFSETVTGFTAGDISFAGSTAGGTLTATVTGTGPTYNVAVSGMTGTSNVVASVLAGAATDAASNASLASTSTDNTVAYNAVAPAPIAFVQVNAATPQTNQSAVTVAYTSAQVAGDTNILAIGWNNTTSTITSVIDSAGNTYQLAVPTASGSGISQAIYYAKNIKAAAAGTNTVTVTFSASTPFVDIRALEYSGLDPVNPFDVGTSASGNGTSANSGTVTTTAAGELIFGAGMTGGVFSAAGTNFTNRIITAQDGDIAEDRFVTTAGSYSATASLSGSHSWLMQVATFKAAT